MSYRISVFLLLLFSLVCGSAQAQTVERVFPFFTGGTDFLWVPTVHISNSAGQAKLVVLRFRNTAGNAQPIGLEERTSFGLIPEAERGVEKDEWPLTISPRTNVVLRVTTRPSSILLFTARVSVPEGVQARALFEFFFTDGRPGGLAFFDQDTVVQERKARYSPAPLGKPVSDPVIGQRLFALFVINRNATTAPYTLTVRNAQEQAIRFESASVVSDGMNLHIFDSPVPQESGSVSVEASLPLDSVSAPFKNELFTALKGVRIVDSPQAALDGPAEGATIQAASVPANVTVVGWRFKPVPTGNPAGALPVVQIYLDGVLVAVEVTNAARADVVNAFPQYAIPANCGFVAQVPVAAFGAHQLRVVVTTDEGGEVSVSRNFTLRAPPVVPREGLFEGMVNTETSSPTGKITRAGPILLSVSGQQVISLDVNTDITCDGKFGYSVALLATSQSPFPINNGVFVKDWDFRDTIPGCTMEAKGNWSSPTTLDFQHQEKGACLDRRLTLQNVAKPPCPDVVISGSLSFVR